VTDETIRRERGAWLRRDPRAARGSATGVQAWTTRLPLSVPVVLLALAFGTSLIAIGFAGGRAHEPWAEAVFLAGWIASVVVLAVAMTSPSLSDRARVTVLALQALQQSFVRWMYSPLYFAFPDELQHWRAASDILIFHHLFHPNPALPVSPGFPGLEEITTALASLSRIGIFPAGLVVAAVSHVALAGAMFYLYRRVSGNPRIAGVAAFLFALNPLHAGFDTMFIYQAPALLLGAVVLEIAVSDRGDQQQQRERAAFLAAVICLAGLVVTHHVTAAFAIGTLGALTVAFAIFRTFGPTAKRTLSLFLLGTAMAILWIATEAQSVVDYLGKPLSTAVRGVLHFGHQSGTVALPATHGSPGAWLTVVATIVTACLVLAGVAAALWRIPAKARLTLPRVFAVFALSYFAVLGVREFAADGAELAGRLLTFAAVFTSVTVALVLVPTWQIGERLRRFVRPAAVAVSVVIFLGATMSGWPAPWELLPGSFRVAGFESGIDRQNREAVQWFRANLGRNRRVACETSICSLAGAYAGAYPIPDEPSLYYATEMTPSVVSLIHRRRIEYLFVDMRMSREAPVSGHLFRTASSRAGLQDPAVPLSGLTKFRGVAGIQLIYDSGPIQIYDVRELPYG
jgi:hypothetical protein